MSESETATERRQLRLAAYQIRLRMERLKPRRSCEIREPISTPRAAAAVARAVIGDRDRECLLVFYLDAQNKLIGGFEIATVGGLNMTRSHPREVFRGAITAGAFAVVLAHNHPSGTLAPSTEDVEFTRAMQRAGELVGMDVYDHLVVSERGFSSLRERGLML